ncbi:MAG: hypothetical protein F2657_00880 [Actinobacteria bacterium]|uniref:Unannotated protein n=1 Tax=freshwater metagenome TaxID=449393 RepID=A0A6J6MSR2_9ZZZZ|nr:hypothetical protein [Actinomycetota bacterium]MSY04720.1 hypothetical protein [Actinomycetota bacterium]MSY66863.1 hypothetical protein [Actinomycetota bacterium]MTA00505.1 hypothetical protein [Actinomycetota bacterium]MTB26689.1 hypothetical protein [Actinomycetota bacterium]
MADLQSPTATPDFFADPVVKLAFGMSATGLELNEIPSDTKIGFSDNGAIRANYPDGSTREFIANDSGGGEMITTFSDGTQIESVLSFEDGVISVSSVSSTGEQTVLTIDENGVNFQSISPDGTISNEIPADFEALVASWVTATEDLASAISTDDSFSEESIDDTDSSGSTGSVSDFYQPGNINGQGAQLWQAGIFANSLDDSPEAQGFPAVEFATEEFGEFEEFEEDIDTDSGATP